MDLDTTDLDRQIASLQAERSKKLLRADQARLAREKEDAKVLVGLTPTKPAQKGLLPPSFPHLSVIITCLLTLRADVAMPGRLAQPVFAPAPRPKLLPRPLPSVPDPGPSRMSTSLAALRRSAADCPSDRLNPNQVSRSSSFSRHAESTAKSAFPSQHFPSVELEVEDKKTVTRDEDTLAIIEDLKLGPRAFGRDPEGEEEWLHLEPNSSIRLS